MKRIILTIISLNTLSLFSYGNSWKGLGTEDEPYLISSPQQMAELAEEVNNGTDFQNIFFSLTNDIDLSELYKDSLAFIELITRLEEEFDIEIQPTQTSPDTWRSINNIINLVKTCLNN